MQGVLLIVTGTGQGWEGKKRKAAKRREGGYLECVVNGRVEGGPEVRRGHS